MLFAIFAASGFAGLIYESIWTHYLKLFLGHAAYAQTLVLAIFMGGMALGSWISSRKSPRWRNLFAAYAITEAVVGVLGLVFHEIFTSATGLAYDVLLPRLAGSAAAVSALKWGLSAALILPQSVLLGMTFPLMTAGVLRAFPDRPGRSLAMLYFTNSLGAAAGVVVRCFVLVSVRVLGYLQVAMGIAALLTLLAYGGTFHAMRWLILNLARNDLGYGLFNLASNGLALAIMLPATFCAGTTLPLITFHLIRRGCGEMSIGAVYAANTVGAIAGVFFAIHLGLPALGLKGLITLGGALDIALGAALLWSAASGFAGRRAPAALTLASAAAVLLIASFVHLDPRKL